nr:hypothetical protein [Cerasicoccus arenae]
MTTYELWNEPNLDAPSWGHWIGPYDEYLKMFRLGAIAVKRADPTAQVSNGGLAGTELSLVDRFRTYVYEDGTTPLDYIDVLSVHHYTGPIAPEIATVNTNIERNGGSAGQMSFEDNLTELIEWKQRYKPEMKVWMTETGFDTGGRMAVGYREHAAYTPRNILTILGHGVDKVFVYREKGSTPTQHSSSGMLDNDLQPRPAFLTYATLIRVMDGVEHFFQVPHADENVRVYGAVKNGQLILAAWAIEDTAPLGINLGEGQVTDSFGHTGMKQVGTSFPLNIFPTYFSDFNGDVASKILSEAHDGAAE